MERPLDFAARLARWPLTLLLPLLALAVLQGLAWREHLTELDAHKALVSQVRAQQSAAARRALSSAPKAVEPLTPLFQKIESAWRDDIALLRLDADAERAGLSVRARSQTALLSLISRLRQSGVDVRLLSQEILAPETAQGQDGVIAATLELRV